MWRTPLWTAANILWASLVERMRTFLQVGCCIQRADVADGLQVGTMYSVNLHNVK